MCRYVLVAVVVLASSVSARGQESWPAFRGGVHAGVGVGKTLPGVWGPDRNVRWKQEIPGRGWSSPIVTAGRVYLTSVVTSVKGPAARKGLYIQDVLGKVRPGEHRWLVHCLDAGTGKVIWVREAYRGKPSEAIHIKNTYASETPVTDGKRVYAQFGNLGLFCYDLEGKLLWKRRWKPRKMRMGWGTAASPAVHADRVFVVNDNEEESYLLALDATTGKTVWRVARDEKSNWSTPYVWKQAGRVQLVTAGSKRVRSYDLQGKQLWELRGMSIITIPTPFARDGLLYVTSGYVLDPFYKPLYAIRPGATGDITPAKDKEQPPGLAWVQRGVGPYNPSPVVYKGLLYMLYDRGFLACFDARTGKEVYGRQRLGGGASGFTASPWAYNGKIFCLSEDGNTFVIQAGPTFKLLGRNNLDEMSLATPALAQGSLFLRTQSTLYCLRQDAGVKKD
jgi:outer membrane protein assembly factor BamB